MQEEAEIYDRRPRTFMSANFQKRTSELGCYSGASHNVYYVK